MRITHEWQEYDKENSTEGHNVYKDVKKTWQNILEVTFYQNIDWTKIYWALTRTGPRAYCFRDTYTMGNDHMPHIVWFENEHEMRRFQEDLRLQEENARGQTSSQTPTVR